MIFTRNKTTLENNIHSVLLGSATADAFSSFFQTSQFQSADEVSNALASVTEVRWSNNTGIVLSVVDAFLAGKSSFETSDYVYVRFLNTLLGVDTTIIDAHDEYYKISSPFRSALRYAASNDLFGCGESGDDGNDHLCLLYAFPLALQVSGMSLINRFAFIRRFTSLTHNHFDSLFSTFFLAEIYFSLIREHNIIIAITHAQNSLDHIFEFVNDPFLKARFYRFNDLLLTHNVQSDSKETFCVLDTLELVLCSLVTMSSYEDIVMRSISLFPKNTVAITLIGGLGAFVYDTPSIPTTWKKRVESLKELHTIAKRFYHAIPF